MGKIIGGAIALVAIILAVLVGVFYFGLDKAIVAAVNKYGTEVTKSEVKLGEAHVDLTSGRGELKNLSVANPEGFQEPKVFDLAGISVKVNISDSSEKLIHIEEILVSAPAITYEVNETGNNLDALKKNIDDFIKANSNGSSTSDEGAEKGEDPKLIIDRLAITDGKVTVRAPITLNQKIEGNLPVIELKDIGKDEGGADPAEVAAQVANAITKNAMGVIERLGVGKTLQGLKDGLSGVTNKATEAVDTLTKDAPSVDGAGKAVEDAAGAVKKLFD
ncbi:MAG: hypothetical protein JJ879_06555 [Sneathiella sp.]|nr:hypothetical protein [Sneathiella sp.]